MISSSMRWLLSMWFRSESSWSVADELFDDLNALHSQIRVSDLRHRSWRERDRPDLFAHRAEQVRALLSLAEVRLG